MELWATGSKPVSGSRGRPSMEPSAGLCRRMVSPLDPTMFYRHAYDPAKKADAVRVGSQVSFPDIPQRDSPFSYYDSGSTKMQADPVVLPAAEEYISNKRPRLDNTEISRDDAEAAAYPGAIAGNPFSTPHFRLSVGTGKRAQEQPSEALGCSCGEPAPQGSDDEFGDDISFQELLGGDFSLLVHDPSQLRAAQLPHLTFEQRPASSQRSPQAPSPSNPADVLLDRALTSRDRIQQIGSQMRRSAAAKIARFSIPTHSSSHAVLNLQHADGLKEDQGHDRECVSDYSSAPAASGTDFLNTRSSCQDSSRTHPGSRRHHQSCASPVSKNEVSSPLSNSSMAFPTANTTTNRYCTQNGVECSSARRDMSHNTTRLPHSATVSHPLPQNTLRTWSAYTANTELLQAVEKRNHDLAEL